MKLFGSFTSPFVRHARIVVLQTRLECEFIETDFVASAEQSPTKKVPFLKDGDLELTDSMSIIRYMRDKAGQTFLPNIRDLDHYCLVATLLDASANLFFLELSGVNITENTYTQRQLLRVNDGLSYINQLNLCRESADRDVMLRLECFLYWGCFRNRFTLNAFPNLQKVLDSANNDSIFASTAPPIT